MKIVMINTNLFYLSAFNLFLFLFYFLWQGEGKMKIVYLFFNRLVIVKPSWIMFELSHAYF